MTDEIDRAQEINQQFQRDALAAHFRRGIRNVGRLAVGECLDCGAEISEARRKAVPGTTLCVRCQTDHELLSHWRSL